jgi:hypothetical protein
VKVYLEGGPADGRETDTFPSCKAVLVPVQGGRAARYARTDRRRADGAVVFSSNEPGRQGDGESKS